jgi:hypothetical protein
MLFWNAGEAQKRKEKNLIARLISGSNKVQMRKAPGLLVIKKGHELDKPYINK